MYFLFGDRERILRALFDIKPVDEDGQLKDELAEKIVPVLDLRGFTEIVEDIDRNTEGDFPVFWDSFREESRLPARDVLIREIEFLASDASGGPGPVYAKRVKLKVCPADSTVESAIMNVRVSPSLKKLPDSFYSDDLIQSFYSRRPAAREKEIPRPVNETALAYDKNDFFIDDADFFSEDDYRGPKLPEEPPAIYNARRSPVWSFAVAALAISLFLPLVGFLGWGLQKKDAVIKGGEEGYEYLLRAKASALEGDFYRAGDDFGFSLENFSGARNELGRLGAAAVAVLGGLPGGEKAAAAQDLLAIGESVARAGKLISEAASVFTGNSEDILGSFSGGREISGGGKNPAEAVADLGKARDDIVRAAVLADGINPEDFPPDIAANIKEMKEKFPILSVLAARVGDYGEAALEAFGYNNPRKYLLLFENSSELRPNGGFPGTYGVIDFNEGRVSKIFIDGIYNPDGQVLEKVIPPLPLRGVTPTWGLRDSGWFFDYPISAQKAMRFYEKSGGPSVDGVIAITSDFFLDVLRLTGPVYLAGYDLEITVDNFLDEVQTEVEETYDKTLNQPKKILSDLALLVMARLENLPKERSGELAKLLLSGLKEKNILLYFADEKLQNIVKLEGWSGTVEENGGDYLAVVHSNVGGHKTDRFMAGEIKKSVNIKENGGVSGVVTVAGSHGGGQTGKWWYDRKNIDYLRIYLPAGSRVTDAAGFISRDVKDRVDYTEEGFRVDYDLSAVERTIRHDAKLNIDVFEESGKTVVGGWVETAPGGTSAVSVSYDLPFLISRGDVYGLYVQKQPGTSERLTLKVELPAGWRTEWKYPETTVELGGRLAYSAVLESDKIFGFALK